MENTDKKHPPKSRVKPGETEKLKQRLDKKGPVGEDSGSNPKTRPEDPPSEDANGNWRKPITNQDEQDKITNEGTGDKFIPQN